MDDNNTHVSQSEMEQRLTHIEQQLAPGGQPIEVDTPDVIAIADDVNAHLDALNWEIQRIGRDGRRDLAKRYETASQTVSHLRLMLRLAQAKRDAEARRVRDEAELRDVEQVLEELSQQRLALLDEHRRADNEFIANRIRLQGFRLLRQIADEEERKLALQAGLGIASVEDVWNEEARIFRTQRRADRGIRECNQQLPSAS